MNIDFSMFFIMITNQAFSLVSIACAEDNSDVSANQASSWTSVVPLLMIMVVFFFLVIRPQQKKIKEHRNMLCSLKKGEKVTTSGGIIGIITRIDNDNNVVSLDIAENVNIKIKREFISEVTKQ